MFPDLDILFGAGFQTLWFVYVINGMWRNCHYIFHCPSMKVSVVFDTVLQQLDSAAVGIAFRYISLNKQISKEVETKAEGILIQNEIAGDDRKR